MSKLKKRGIERKGEKETKDPGQQTDGMSILWI